MDINCVLVFNIEKNMTTIPEISEAEQAVNTIVDTTNPQEFKKRLDYFQENLNWQSGEQVSKVCMMLAYTLYLCAVKGYKSKDMLHRLIEESKALLKHDKDSHIALLYFSNIEATLSAASKYGRERSFNGMLYFLKESLNLVWLGYAASNN